MAQLLRRLQQRLERKNFWLKLLHWEYWPIYVANIPVVAFWWWFALRARRLFFFSAVNPAIETGGVLGESKVAILRRIPKAFLPITVFISPQTAFKNVLEQLRNSGLDFPVVAKPNVGERGLFVQILANEAALKAYHDNFPYDFLLQEYVDWEEEVSVLYHRFPDQERGQVTSICLKKKLAVTGDGNRTIRELMQADGRARLQLARFESQQAELLDQVPEEGRTLLLEPIGNHSRGTQFLSGNHLITPEISRTFDQIGSKMEGIHYGRFDLKCRNLDSLTSGDGIRILEFNGVAGEPAHIYDPALPILQKYRDYFQHWKIIFRIYRVQRRRGVAPMTFHEAMHAYRAYSAYMKAVHSLVPKN